ncbi:VOC family protein [Aggregatilinea lenta]|uniref:VOC family protein n=1 Tax=Aggregatilinea lenta TaxID=913108 RepID=UPI000E5B8399|nr:VOC family protein [Aggregatilinea lenta]
MDVKFQSTVLFVRDVPASRQFYEGLLGMQVVADFGLNVGYTGGLAIWEAEYANQLIYNRPASAGKLGCDNVEVYFEAADLDEVAAQLAEAQVPTAHPIQAQPWGQRVLRVYDPDGYLIEIGEPLDVVVVRFRKEGLSPEAIAETMYMPLEAVQGILQDASA